MQVSDPNNVKIYNLSSGKSIPEWLSDRKKRALLKSNVDLRRRIELIQDFQMPAVSTCIRLSPDEHYVLASGIYKPRVRCYDVDNLAMKFERCFDSEVITFEILSEDYTKVVFLQCDRFIEFHSAEGRYYRLRMPKFGHDMKYHQSFCDLYLVGASSEIYRLNLEKGQYQTSLVSKQSTEINKVAINQVHGLVLTGGKEGKLEAWDPRSGSCVASLDCALSCLMNNESSNEVPAITALKFDGNLSYGVGMSTGQVMLYDVRTNRPYRVKNHMNELPIKDVEFLGDHVLSLDASILKIWNKETGNLFTSIDAGKTTFFNSLCVVPRSGMLFIANENVKIQTYYIPSLGPAPRWCGFLDALTEELEENKQETVYDDYKFVTEKQVEELGLSHLIGTDLLRAYMHGFFIDIRLYKKAKSVAEPFDFEQYKKKKIKEKLDEEVTNRVKIEDNLPPVNKVLALKLLEEKNSSRKKARNAASLLGDDRFKPLFENPEFEVDPNAEEYRLLNPVLRRLDERREDVKKLIANKFNKFEINEDRFDSSSDSSSDEAEGSNSEDNSPAKSSVPPKKCERKVSNVVSEKREKQSRDVVKPNSKSRTKFYELEPGQEVSIFSSDKVDHDEIDSKLLGDRAAEADENTVDVFRYGNKTFTFTPSKNKLEHKRELEMEKHRAERKRLFRPGPKFKKLKFH